MNTRASAIHGLIGVVLPVLLGACTVPSASLHSTTRQTYLLQRPGAIVIDCDCKRLETVDSGQIELALCLGHPTTTAPTEAHREIHLQSGAIGQYAGRQYCTAMQIVGSERSCYVTSAKGVQTVAEAPAGATCQPDLPNAQRMLDALVCQSVCRSSTAELTSHLKQRGDGEQSSPSVENR